MGGIFKMSKKSKKQRKKKSDIKKQADKIKDWVKRETTLPEDVMGV
jgi:ribosomal protein S19